MLDLWQSKMLLVNDLTCILMMIVVFLRQTSWPAKTKFAHRLLLRFLSRSLNLDP